MAKRVLCPELADENEPSLRSSVGRGMTLGTRTKKLLDT